MQGIAMVCTGLYIFELRGKILHSRAILGEIESVNPRLPVGCVSNGEASEYCVKVGTMLRVAFSGKILYSDAWLPV